MNGNGQLLTFGCSWTFGVGACWQPDMSESEFKKQAWSEFSEREAFRTKLCNKYDLKNINYAKGASSNARNFRIASELFADKTKREELQDNNTIVLWGITSTARHEWYSVENEDYLNFKLDTRGDKSELHDLCSEFYGRNIYDHDREVEQLTNQMILWNNLFKHYDIKNVWYDTFNIHDYPKEINNLIRPDDLLSGMLKQDGIKYNTDEKFYHFSTWRLDDQRISVARDAQLVDPFTLHPTRRGHDILTRLLSPYIEDCL